MFFGRRRPDPASGHDDDAFTSEALDLLDSLYGTALRLARDADRAQDLVQDTYLKAFRARDRFAAGTNLKAWLFTILHNTWRNRRRDQARSRVEFDSDAVEQADERAALDSGVQPASPEALLLRASFDAELQAALDALPEKFRDAVWLRDVEGSVVPGDCRGPGDSDRHGDVAHFARPKAAARPAACRDRTPACDALRVD